MAVAQKPRAICKYFPHTHTHTHTSQHIPLASLSSQLSSPKRHRFLPLPLIDIHSSQTHSYITTGNQRKGKQSTQPRADQKGGVKELQGMEIWEDTKGSIEVESKRGDTRGRMGRGKEERIETINRTETHKLSDCCRGGAVGEGREG